MVSLGRMGVLCAQSIAPVSTLVSRKNIVHPVSSSPCAMAQCMGAAPRYLGNNDACTLIDPILGNSNTEGGNTLKATTTKRSAFSFLKDSIKSTLCVDEVVITGIPCSRAKAFTGVGVAGLALPRLLSSPLTTANSS